MANMGKGILKRHDESIEAIDNTPDSCSKHVKWDEEKLKVSEAIKLTIPKGQIDEPKTPFQHGQNGSSCDDCADEAFKLKSGDETEEGSLSDSSFRRTSLASTASSTAGSSWGWESSLSEVETDADESKECSEAFKSMRSQHYFMKQSLQRGKELMETEDEGEYEFNE